MKVATTARSRVRQEQLGQFLTPAPVAHFMASMFGRLPTRLRLLDPGAGAGALTSALASRLTREGSVQAIDATLFELDPAILGVLSANMHACKEHCAQAGVQFSFTIVPVNFILEMSACLTGGLFGAVPPAFDAAIANPPYRKISTDSPERLALRSIGVETSNLYAAFVAVAQRLLVPGGQLVAITPRSFCNGPYFRPFREDLLSSVDLRRIHVFDSREAAFRDDGVLQENVVVHAIKGRKQNREVIVSSSSGKHGDITNEVIVPFTEIVHPRDDEKFIHIPSAATHEAAKEAMDGLSSDLASLGVTVSTGPVVDFRLKGALRKEPERGTAPLLYPCHFSGGTVRWPKAEARKPNAILDNDETRPWLVPSGMYLLTKRFTSKEEKRRLVACVFDPDQVKAPWVGFENHLNYFHAKGRGLDRYLAAGLYAFLNSTMVDQYFRRFSGHTQVNATDLRTLAYPNRDTLRAMGRAMKTLNLSQEEIDQLVSQHVHAHH